MLCRLVQTPHQARARESLSMHFERIQERCRERWWGRATHHQRCRLVPLRLAQCFLIPRPPEFRIRRILLPRILYPKCPCVFPPKHSPRFAAVPGVCTGVVVEPRCCFSVPISLLPSQHRDISLYPESSNPGPPSLLLPTCLLPNRSSRIGLLVFLRRGR